MTYNEEIKQAFNLIVGSGSHAKLWVRVVFSPLVLLCFLIAYLWITADKLFSK